MTITPPSPDGPGLRERKNARTRAAITRAALELALESGFEHATVAKIAERADVAPRTVHQWFPSKDDIVLSAVDLPIDRLRTELGMGEGTTLDRIRRWLDAERQENTEPDDLARLRHQVLLTDPHLRAGQRVRQQDVEDLIADAIADEAGLPHHAVAPHALAAAIVTSLLAMQARFAAENEDYARDFAGTQAMLSAALDALRSGDARTTPTPRGAR